MCIKWGCASRGDLRYGFLLDTKCSALGFMPELVWSLYSYDTPVLMIMQFPLYDSSHLNIFSISFPIETTLHILSKTLFTLTTLA